MPKYTFEIDGKKYSVTSDVQPTKEQLLELTQSQQVSEPTIQPLETKPTTQQQNSYVQVKEPEKLLKKK